MTYDAECTFPEGTLYVTILPAVTKHERWGDREMTLPEGRLGISSSCHEDYPGFVKIRGRRYRVASRRGRAHAARESLLRCDDPDASLWTYQSPLHRRWEFTNGLDQEVSRESVARGRLDAMVREAADRFEVECPEWVRISERLELEHLVQAASVEVATATRALHQAENYAARMRDRLAECRDRLANYVD
ncbi:hypothetical protein [Streptomyces sp. NPDC057552]|uniref:hypothetical protein n=1 Tax=Streptomyces sp. NPDC057552 TaxID=3350537 RepID=UPI0036B09816